MSSQPASWLIMVAILLVIGVVWMLFCRRTRGLALGLLGIAALGMVFLRVSHRPSPVRVYDGDTAHMEQLFDVRQPHAVMIQAEQADILQNQRMAAQMDDAFVQKSPDGSTLETYPDGMQVRQRGSDGFRSIVRSARGDGGRWESSHSTRSEVKFFLLGAPLLALVVAFVALKRAKNSGAAGFGAGLAVAGLAAMLLFGFVFWGSIRHVRTGTEAQVAEVELAPSRIMAESQTEFDRAHHEMLGNWQEVVQQEPIETLWTKLTAPRIDLNAQVDAEAKATQRELANAAKVILSASAPGADPFTQGWLMNAAKAIMSASPKGEVAPGTPAAPLKVVTVSKSGAADASAAVTEKQTTGKPRPDWIDNPPKLAGDTRRVIVSTDPLNTTEECHAQLEKRLRYAVADRIRELAKQATGRSAVDSPMLADMGISPDFILRELCPDGAYVETVNGSAGELKRAHALVEFTPQKDDLLLQRWQSATGTPVTRSVASEAPPRANAYTTGERPDWVDQPPKLVGTTRRVVVSTDPYSTVEECHVALRSKLSDVVQSRIHELAVAANGGRHVSTPSLPWMGISIEYILAELCTEPDYIETVNASFGEMKRAHALVEFNEAQDRFLLDRWRAYARVQSIEIVAGLSAFVVAVLGFVYGLLKVDTWTRGYYTKRLFLGVPAAIIAVFFVAALFGF
ncbi:MAG: hypothetical protein H0T51_23745 [Pirellulales bacterium]|nr:hypothetical protein [Pirellulales bacterium]